MILGICGLGGSGKEILELAKFINERHERWQEYIFIDKIVEQNEFKGCKILTFEQSIERYKKEEIEYCISVGEPFLRDKIFKQIKDLDYQLAKLVVPNIHIPDSTQIGEGAIIRDNAFISVDAKIGCNVMVQPNAVIGHDCIIGNNTVISSLSVVAGGCTIGDKTFVALGCNIKELVKIGNGTIISMGSIVNKNIGDGVIAKGNPAEVVSRNFFNGVFKFNHKK